MDTPHTRRTFFVGGEYVKGPDEMHTMQGQMYVEHLAPASVPLKETPIVFIHGATRTGIDWLTKPDGKPGWASFFLSQGYECYVIDQPFQGRSRPVWGDKSRNFSAEALQRLFIAPERYNIWPQAELHTQWPGTGIMREDPAFDQMYASGQDLPGDAESQQLAAQAAMAALLDQIGKPVILLGHSQGGIVPWVTAEVRPKLIQAIVNVEPKGPPFQDGMFNRPKQPARAWGLADIPITYDPPVENPAEDLVKVTKKAESDSQEDAILQAEPAKMLVHLQNIPVLIVTGEASYHAVYEWCIIEYLKQGGVKTTHLDLGKHGIHGNAHMMFMEKNSDDIAAKIKSWIETLESSSDNS